jgi:hypothetical protein
MNEGPSAGAALRRSRGYAGSVIIHRSPSGRTQRLVFVGLLTVLFGLRADGLEQWVLVGLVWFVIAAAIVWSYRRGRRSDKPPPWAV